MCAHGMQPICLQHSALLYGAESGACMVRISTDSSLQCIFQTFAGNEIIQAARLAQQLQIVLPGQGQVTTQTIALKANPNAQQKIPRIMKNSIKMHPIGPLV
mmetsp:Transcript_25391/g.47404  ORF Transcript_25391/g.47404 Transcript_25391/m.47404 type:complete len:102 (-) Transcript_25391:207-512(-)